MPFQLNWTAEGRANYDALRAAAHAKGVFKQVVKAINLLMNDPKHPGLNSHEYDSIENPIDKTLKVWESYVQNKTPGAYRLFWSYGPARGQITIIAITPHP
jgi:hypothetical protein